MFMRYGRAVYHRNDTAIILFSKEYEKIGDIKQHAEQLIKKSKDRHRRQVTMLEECINIIQDDSKIIGLELNKYRRILEKLLGEIEKPAFAKAVFDYDLALIYLAEFRSVDKKIDSVEHSLKRYREQVFNCLGLMFMLKRNLEEI